MGVQQPRVTAEQIARMRSLRQAGMTIDAVKAACGSTKRTIQKYTFDIDPGECGCGRPIGHSGWCKWKLTNRPEEAAALIAARSRGKQKWTAEAKAFATAAYLMGHHIKDIRHGLSVLLDRPEIELLRPERIRKYLNLVRPKRRNGIRVYTNRPRRSLMIQFLNGWMAHSDFSLTNS